MSVPSWGVGGWVVGGLEKSIQSQRVVLCWAWTGSVDWNNYTFPLSAFFIRHSATWRRDTLARLVCPTMTRSIFSLLSCWWWRISDSRRRPVCLIGSCTTAHLQADVEDTFVPSVPASTACCFCTGTDTRPVWPSSRSQLFLLPLFNDSCHWSQCLCEDKISTHIFSDGFFCLCTCYIRWNASALL